MKWACWTVSLPFPYSHVPCQTLALITFLPHLQFYKIFLVLKIPNVRVCSQHLHFHWIIWDWSSFNMGFSFHLLEHHLPTAPHSCSLSPIICLLSIASLAQPFSLLISFTTPLHFPHIPTQFMGERDKRKGESLKKWFKFHRGPACLYCWLYCWYSLHLFFHS